MTAQSGTVHALEDAIDGLPARRLEELKTRIERRLRACAIDGVDGALPVQARVRIRGMDTRMTFLLCPACIERHRLPEGRAET